ncbi:carbohydrate ABC transporter permease [Streptomyces sp. 110]|uniref:Carbohydrate ABC transporter permease n=1 Tax=Streptomyces endocoffeicus TaxID=2898945 RepID=A0ABS1Q686_9ACTN|nr:carbohydrate ABC transporter permease [Streptomyces endocoffeicus]MBL1120167.1 carbohydrate ABC transporter permease [Streptomyces endocoffeicus]
MTTSLRTTTDTRPRHTKRRAGRLTVQLVMTAACILTAAPVVWMIGISFKRPADIFDSPLNPLPTHPTLANYVDAFTTSDVPHQFLNSMIFAGGTTLGQLAVAVPAAYAFSQWTFRGANVLFTIFLASLPIPFIVFLIPNYILVAQAGLLNTYGGLIIPQLASAYGVFLLRQHFRTFPRAILEAARLDGASETTVITRILLPAVRGPVVSLGVFVFVGAWNEYVWPSLVAPRPDMQILTVGLAQFASAEGGNQWGPTMAAATLVSVPTLAAYLLLRRQIVAAVAAGTVHG